MHILYLLLATASIPNGRRGLVDGLCTLPEQRQNIDWNKFSGDWYEILHHLAYSEYNFPCALTNDIHSSPGGMACTTTLYNPSTNWTVRIPLHIYRNNDGSYREYFSPGNVVKKARTSIVEIEVGNQEENGGRQNIWVDSPNSRPTAADVLRIRNKLVQISSGWSELELSFRICDDPNWLTRTRKTSDSSHKANQR
uniref:uncharacterized protein LOC120340959 isoform X2 n=1 Tax=Styela clava TaxID=7725 RepID=UPI00193A8342|nr:uncharacterized protein LOC120340959 isoform X2 [Styela clava]